MNTTTTRRRCNSFVDNDVVTFSLWLLSSFISWHNLTPTYMCWRLTASHAKDIKSVCRTPMPMHYYTIARHHRLRRRLPMIFYSRCRNKMSLDTVEIRLSRENNVLSSNNSSVCISFSHIVSVVRINNQQWWVYWNEDNWLGKLSWRAYISGKWNSICNFQQSSSRAASEKKNHFECRWEYVECKTVVLFKMLRDEMRVRFLQFLGVCVELRECHSMGEENTYATNLARVDHGRWRCVLTVCVLHWCADNAKGDTRRE